MGCEAAQGYQGRLAVKANPVGDWSTGATMVEIQSEAVRLQGSLINTAGLRGTRRRETVRSVQGTSSVGGPITFNPSPRDFQTFLPLVGFSFSSPNWTLTEGLAEFGVLIDRVTEVFQYTSCVCSRVTLRGSEGSLLEMTVEVVGTGEVLGTSFPSLTFSSTEDGQPYMVFDSVLTLDGTARPFNSFELVLEHTIDTRYRNSQTPASICPTDRVITLRTNQPYTDDETDLYPFDATAAGIAGIIALSHASTSTTINFPHLKAPDRSPTIPGRQEIPLELEMQAFASASNTSEIVIQNDVTV